MLSPAPNTRNPIIHCFTVTQGYVPVSPSPLPVVMYTMKKLLMKVKIKE